MRPSLFAALTLLAVVAVLTRFAHVTPYTTATAATPPTASVSPAPETSGLLYGAIFVDSATSQVDWSHPYTDDLAIYPWPADGQVDDKAPPFRTVHPNHRGHYEVTLPSGRYELVLPGIDITHYQPRDVTITPGGKLRCDLTVTVVWGG